MHLWQRLQQSLVCKGALGLLFGFPSLVLASSKASLHMVILIQPVCSVNGPKDAKDVCIEVVDSQDATMEGQASDQVSPAVDLQGLEVSKGEVVSPLLSHAVEPEPDASSPCVECVPAPECESLADPPLPESLSNGDDVVVDDGSGGEGLEEESQADAKMVEVESLNLDMFHVSGESEEEEKVDFLRRRDQQTAMKADAPAPKGRGRGKGKGKGKGKGRGRGKKQQKEEHEEEVHEKTEDKRPGKGKGKKSKDKLEGNGKEEKAKGKKKCKAEKVLEDQEPKVTGKASKRKAKTLEEKEQSAAPKARKPRQSNKKAKAIPAASAASALDPAPHAVPDVHPAPSEAVADQAVPPAAPALAPNPKPKQQGTRVPNKIKKQLIPLIKTYTHSYVVPYWSRSAVGLKIRNASGSSSQAGLVSCACVYCSSGCGQTKSSFCCGLQTL